MKEETAQNELMGNVILCGDFNGRIGLNSDFVENNEKDEFLPLPKDYEPQNVELINRKSLGPEHDLKGNERALFKILYGEWFSSSKRPHWKRSIRRKHHLLQQKGNSVVDYLPIKEKDFI